jgi:aminopeptidase N
MALGFRHVNDPGVLEPLVARYFEALTTVWTTRSYKIAEYIISGFYPSPLASRALIDATNAWLDANPGIPALRRLVIEGLAGVERAVAAQERDLKA